MTNTENQTITLYATTTREYRFGNRHGVKSYPAGTLVEFNEVHVGGRLAYVRVAGKRSISAVIPFAGMVCA